MIEPLPQHVVGDRIRRPTDVRSLLRRARYQLHGVGADTYDLDEIIEETDTAVRFYERLRTDNAGRWPVCVDCEERHAPDYDCKTYAPVCACGHRGDRRFRFCRPGVLRDVLAPSLGPEHLECSQCEGTDIRMEVVTDA